MWSPLFLCAPSKPYASTQGLKIMYCCMRITTTCAREDTTSPVVLPPWQFQGVVSFVHGVHWGPCYRYPVVSMLKRNWMLDCFDLQGTGGYFPDCQQTTLSWTRRFGVWPTWFAFNQWIIFQCCWGWCNQNNDRQYHLDIFVFQM